jgi:hypothetical protein
MYRAGSSILSSAYTPPTGTSAFTHTYLGRSWWPDALSCIDYREFVWYATALSDSDLMSQTNSLAAAYG